MWGGGEGNIEHMVLWRNQLLMVIIIIIIYSSLSLHPFPLKVTLGINLFKVL